MTSGDLLGFFQRFGAIDSFYERNIFFQIVDIHVSGFTVS